MATSNVASVMSASSVPVGADGPLISGKSWDHSTESVAITDTHVFHFVGATGDSQKPHLDDAAARALPFNLSGRVVHGALVRDIAVNFLIQNHLATMLRVEKTHAAMDQGGSYIPFHPVYPGESIYVRHNYLGRARPYASFPISIDYAVFVIRDGVELKVMEGQHKALLVRYPKTDEADKP